MRTNFEGDVPTVMYCYRLEEKMGEEFARHVHEMSLQGWRLAYVSEYTSTSKSKFAITYCVEGVGIRHLPVDQKDKATQ
jgi:hypothetical protein